MRKDADNPQVIQSIWHKATVFTQEEAKSWCEEHDFKTDDYRSRFDEDDAELVTHHIHAQFDPSEGIEDSWAFISDDFPEGVSASTCQREESKSMKLTYIKGVQSADDPFKFIMSEESIDRIGDVIVAKGWQLADFKKNPIALWGHDHRTPIGVWENVKIVGKQLVGYLKFAKEGTSAEIDTLRSLVEQRILKAVSVGFQPLEWEDITDKKGGWLGFKFLKQALHETSLVSVPAHPNALATAKSFGLSRQQFETLFSGNGNKGQNAAPSGSTRSTQGTAAKPDARTQSTFNKGTTGMKTIAEKILAKQARLVQIKDRLTEIKSILEADETAELSDEDQAELVTLTEETEVIERSVEGLQTIEKGLANHAQPAAPGVPGTTTARGIAPGPHQKQEKGGSLLAKVATARLIAFHKGVSPHEALQGLYGHDDRIKAVSDYIAKTATVGATTTAAGWAAELVEDDLQGFLDDLAPISVYAALRAKGIPLVFGGANSVTIPKRSSATGITNDVAGSWVGEGGAIPVKRLDLGSQTLNRYKAAVISTFSQEILDQSVPSVEAIVRQAMLDDTAVTLDSALLGSSNVVAGVRPAGLLYGLTPTASAGDTAANIRTDLKVLFAAMLAANVGPNPVLIMNSSSGSLWS